MPARFDSKPKWSSTATAAGHGWRCERRAGADRDVRATAAGILLSCCLLILLLSGCQALNNRWIRVRRSNNPDVARSKLSIPGLLGPRERVQRFFQSYELRDWKSMDSAIEARSDLHLIKDKAQADFQKYVEIHAKISLKKAVYNKAEDRAQVDVEFSIEKIDAQSGALHVAKGAGSFVMTSRAGWAILGYVGDPFWGDGKK